MNMHVMPPPISLDELKARRSVVRAKFEPIERSRRALAADAEALEIARKELADFEAREGDATAKWVACDCKGARPEADLDRHATLTQRVAAAARVVENGKTANDDLAIREAGIHEELHEIGDQLESAAAYQLGNEFAAMAVVDPR